MPTCYAVASPTYQPAMRIITAISRAEQAAVTTSFAHNYTTGDYVRIYVPSTFGMSQINQQAGYITVTGDNSFDIDIDTSNYDAFAVPVPQTRCAFVVPIGEENSRLTSATRNVL